jgi:hypothetical protein
MQPWQIIAISVAVVLVVVAAIGLIFQKSRARRLREGLLPLNTADRLRFSSEWMKCQIAFVEDPACAVDTADHLISEVLRARGCSVANAYDRAATICAAYPKHVKDFRAADEIVVRHHRGRASTEDLRKAFIRYRALFEDILGVRHEELKRAA